MLQALGQARVGDRRHQGQVVAPAARREHFTHDVGHVLEGELHQRVGALHRPRVVAVRRSIEVGVQVERLGLTRTQRTHPVVHGKRIPRGVVADEDQATRLLRFASVRVFDGHADLGAVQFAFLRNDPFEVVVHGGRRAVGPCHRVVGVAGSEGRVHTQHGILPWLDAASVAVRDGAAQEDVDVNRCHDVDERTVGVVERRRASAFRHRHAVRTGFAHFPLVVVHVVHFVAVVGPLVNEVGVLVAGNRVELDGGAFPTEVVVLEDGLRHCRVFHLVGVFAAPILHRHHVGACRVLVKRVLVLKHVVVAGERPVDGGHVCRVGDEHFQFQVVVSTSPNQAVPINLDGRRLVHFHLVAGGCAAFLFVEAELVQSKFRGRPRRVELVRHREAVVAQTRRFLPRSKGWLDLTQGRSIEHHRCGQVVERRTSIRVADAVVHAVEHVKAEVLVVVGVVAHKRDLDGVAVHNRQFRHVIDVGEVPTGQGDR